MAKIYKQFEVDNSLFPHQIIDIINSAAFVIKLNRTVVYNRIIFLYSANAAERSIENKEWNEK